MMLLGRSVACAVLLALASGAATFDELAAKATAAREANRLAEAAGFYREALQLKADWSEGWWFLGTIAYDGDQYEDARRAFAEFVKFEDKAAAGWSFLGLCEFETGDYAHSLEHVRRGLEIGTGLQEGLEPVLRFHEALL